MDREILSTSKSRPTIEGAGVHLKRAFGFGDTSISDPFLLLDDFRARNQRDYREGFPWHPHRGIETITYMLRGRVEHQDSMGNKGVIGPGDVQWMTAGRGIIHQEMPEPGEVIAGPTVVNAKREFGTFGDAGAEAIEGFQLWTNLPASKKLIKPRYQEVSAATIPEHVLEDGSRVRVISGTFGPVRGPVEDIVTDPDYLDLTLAPGADFYHSVHAGVTAFAYVIGGRGAFGSSPDEVGDGTLVFFTDGDRIRFRSAKDEPFRFLFCSGLRIDEPVAWHGPIVMNTQEELETAFAQLRSDTFL